MLDILMERRREREAIPFARHAKCFSWGASLRLVLGCSYNWRYNALEMEFEWDEAKNRSNIRKHGLDFADAAAAFDGPLLVAPDVREHGENRLIGVGMILNRVVVVVFMQLAANRVRVISLRKATRSERLRFESEVASQLWNIEKN
jgi:uncharacterized DUF497 family protein